MSPRRSILEAAATHEAILAIGVRIASVEGLEGLTIGRLAAALDMSKAGVLGHFGNKEALQLDVLEAAARIFRREVPGRAAGATPGLARLRSICDAWLSYLDRDVFPGGCFFTAAASEFDGRPGRVRTAIADHLSTWTRFLETEARAAVDAGDLPADRDPAQVAFDLMGVALAVNQRLQLHGDKSALARARHAFRRVLSPG
ncbi:TetR/AcrR family transcriptional regulator [Flindersiella endophytica]